MGNAKKIKLSASEGKTSQDGFEEYVLDMKARNLRSGTITHYKESIKQIYKHIPSDTLISAFSPNAMPQFLIELRDNPKLNDVSMGTYARDLKTLMRFFTRFYNLSRMIENNALTFEKFLYCSFPFLATCHTYGNFSKSQML